MRHQTKRLVRARLQVEQNNRCGICGHLLGSGHASMRNPLAPTLDHIVPRSRGGSDHHTNLRVTHYGCNNRRQARYDSRENEVPPEGKRPEGFKPRDPGPQSIRFPQEHEPRATLSKSCRKTGPRRGSRSEAKFQKALKLPLTSRIRGIRSNVYIVEFTYGRYIAKELGPFKSREEAILAFEAHQSPLPCAPDLRTPPRLFQSAAIAVRP